MLQNWSIRSVLTVVGGVLVGVTALVGGLGLFALGHANSAIDTIAHGDLPAIHTLDLASSNLLRARVSLDRFKTLAETGNSDEAQKVLDRAQALYAQSAKSWEAFQGAPKEGIDAALLNTLAERHAALTQNGVDPEFAAARAGDLPAYHAIADTKISPMFVAYDAAAADVVAAYEKQADLRQAGTQSNIALMKALIGAGIALAFLLVFAVRFALRGLIVQPLNDAVAQFERIAAGDLTQPVRAGGSNEIGRLYGGIKRMQEALTAMVREVSRGAE